jgi:hypothetical protein
MSEASLKQLQAPDEHTEIKFHDFQWPVFNDRKSGIAVLHWSRQIGKSFTLAAWAVDRLMTRPGRLVTVLSNSRENGAEFLAKCAEVCTMRRTRYEQVDRSLTFRFEHMRMELRIRVERRLGRIKVLAANPRTARGFSGDLILDEFAFHEDSNAIWEAVEPILASHQDYRCRIASTGNGRHNMFYRLAAPGLGGGEEVDQGGPKEEHPMGVCMSVSRSGHTLSRVTRTQAWWLGRRFMIRTHGRKSNPRPRGPGRWTSGRTTRITSARSRMKTWRCCRTS